MAHPYDQKWPVEPRTSILHGLGPDVTRSNGIHATRETTAKFLLLSLQVASSIHIMSYDPSHSASRERPQSLYIHGWMFQVPALIRDPSPATFMLACLTYAFTTAVFSRLHPSDQYQYHCLLLAVGFATFLVYVDIGAMKTWLPLSITAALALSASLHYAFPSLRSEMIEEAQGEKNASETALCEKKQCEATS